ncbi:MAG: hypothetical protein K0R88_2752 [Solirubrobacterales bacterium]|nr:hypothetical protein [Solirubrobacterales bacterium]
MHALGAELANGLLSYVKALDTERDKTTLGILRLVVEGDSELREGLREPLAGGIRSRVAGAILLAAGILLSVAGSVISAAT